MWDTHSYQVCPIWPVTMGGACPVLNDVEANGAPIQEMHVNVGATKQIAVATERRSDLRCLSATEPNIIQFHYHATAGLISAPPRVFPNASDLVPKRLVSAASLSA